MNNIIMPFGSLCFLLWFSLSVQGQTTDHRLRQGDHVERQRIEYSLDKNGGAEMIWDLRGISISDKKSKIVFFSTPGTSDTISCSDTHKLSRYIQKGDTLCLIGYESNLMKTTYDTPIAQLCTPLAYGNRIEGMYRGKLSYCDKLLFDIDGNYQTTVDALGTLYLPSGKTLKHVHRVHIHREETYEYCPHTMDTLVSESKSKNTANGLTKSSGSMQVTDHYRWYADGYRYPVLESVTNSQEAPVTFYCSPESQAKITDRINENTRDKLLQANSSHDDKDAFKPHYTIEIKNQNIIVDYEVSRSTSIRFMVCLLSGIVLRQHSQYVQGNTRQQVNIDCNGLRHGQYIFVVQIDDKTENRTINL